MTQTLELNADAVLRAAKELWDLLDEIETQAPAGSKAARKAQQRHKILVMQDDGSLIFPEGE